MTNGKAFGSSHAASSPPKKKADSVHTTPGDPLRDEIRKTPKRLEDPRDPEHGDVEQDNDEEGTQRGKPKDAI